MITMYCICVLKLSDMFTVCEVWPMLYMNTKCWCEEYIIEYCKNWG